MKPRTSTQSNKSSTSSVASMSTLKARRQAKIDLKAKKSRSTKRVFTESSYSNWTANEHKVCMKAVHKHGTNYNLIALAIKTKNSEQIRRRLKRLLKQTKVDNHHPDRHILRLYKKQLTFHRGWTREETEVLVKAVRKHGKNYQMIANALKHRTVKQV